MRWAEKQRMNFIGERLLSGETLSRAHITNKFGVSVQQASLDINRFKAAHPGAMRYDRTRKMYVADCLSSVEGRNTTAAAKHLILADDARLEEIAHRDPSMIRDVAAALLYERQHSD